ncbi:MAG TPA: TatD family hydrolase [Stellaceae bacterium]|nr:TatD family hydrolase [Stellaceae bacterium]
MLVDSHCHIDFAEPDERPALIERARAAGVATMLTIGTKAEELPEVIEIASSDPDIWCSIGVHPHEAAATPDGVMDQLTDLVSHPKVVGIGETGLDFHYDHSPRERQAQLFRAQCRLARAAGLPVIVHSRSADTKTAAILAEEGMSRGVIHCFSTSRALSEPALALGFYISISGIVTFKNADELRGIVAEIPLDRLLIETDAPYLAPVPLRGQTNEPAFIVHTAAKVAELKGISVEELGRATSDNFFRLFAKARRPAWV